MHYDSVMGVRMKTAIYLRSSTAKQDKGLDAQRRAIDAFLSQRSIDPNDVLIFEDNGVSGAKKNRPGLNSLFECVHRGEVKTVICYSFSRISRSIRDLIDIVELLEDNKVVELPRFGGQVLTSDFSL